MRKIAIFVEGMTEVVFTDWLLRELLGSYFVAIRRHSWAKDKIISFAAATKGPDAKLFVLLVDCSGDGSVKSRINENLKTMEREHYDCIFGLRDVFPSPQSQLASIERALGKGLKASSISIRLFLAVAETEAWFLQDGTHYARIDSKLSTSSAIASIGFDPNNDSAEQRHHPSEDLDTIYKTAKKSYKKRRNQVKKTVRSLDIEHLYFLVPSLVPRLFMFMSAIIEESGI